MVKVEWLQDCLVRRREEGREEMGGEGGRKGRRERGGRGTGTSE